LEEKGRCLQLAIFIKWQNKSDFQSMVIIPVCENKLTTRLKIAIGFSMARQQYNYYLLVKRKGCY
jgi:hypothetical protein